MAHSSAVLVYAVVDDSFSRDFPLGKALEVYVRREDAERFIEELRGTSRSSRGICGSRSARSRSAVKLVG